MKGSGKHELTGNVGVDEFLKGGFSAGEPGRSHGSLGYDGACYGKSD